MKIHTRSQLLAALREKCGFDGAEDWSTVEKFIKDNEIAVDGDVKKAWDTTSLKTVKIAITADAGEEVEVSDGAAVEGESAVQPEDEVPPAKSVRKINKAASVDAGRKAMQTPQGFARAAARKAYNQKAAAGQTAYPDADLAEAAGAWMRLAIAGPHNYAQKSIDSDIVGKTMVTTNNTLGGAFVPEEFQATLIDLKEERGVARQVCPFIPMSRDTLTLPRRTSGYTVYFPGEGGSTTASDANTDNVNLVAQKMAVIAKVSSELMNDSALSMSDFISREIAYAFADKEDECFFNGDATATYGGILGVRAKLKGLSGTYANIAGVTVAAGNLFTELTYAELLNVAGKLPEYASKNAKWVCSRAFQYQGLERACATLGAATTGPAGSGRSEALQSVSSNPLGYPLVVSQVMPRVDANDQVNILLGDFSAAAKCGEVRGGMSIMPSEHFYFDTDVIAIRGIQRVAITVHDVGNASATAASRVAGPVVGIMSAAS